MSGKGKKKAAPKKGASIPAAAPPPSTYVSSPAPMFSVAHPGSSSHYLPTAPAYPLVPDHYIPPAMPAPPTPIINARSNPPARRGRPPKAQPPQQVPIPVVQPTPASPTALPRSSRVGRGENGARVQLARVGDAVEAPQTKKRTAVSIADHDQVSINPLAPIPKSSKRPRRAVVRFFFLPVLLLNYSSD